MIFLKLRAQQREAFGRMEIRMSRAVPLLAGTNKAGEPAKDSLETIVDLPAIRKSHTERQPCNAVR